MVLRATHYCLDRASVRSFNLDRAIFHGDLPCAAFLQSARRIPAASCVFVHQCSFKCADILSSTRLAQICAHQPRSPACSRHDHACMRSGRGTLLLLSVLLQVGDAGLRALGAHCALLTELDLSDTVRGPPYPDPSRDPLPDLVHPL